MTLFFLCFAPCVDLPSNLFYLAGPSCEKPFYFCNFLNSAHVTPHQSICRNVNILNKRPVVIIFVYLCQIGKKRVAPFVPFWYICLSCDHNPNMEDNNRMKDFQKLSSQSLADAMRQHSAENFNLYRKEVPLWIPDLFGANLQDANLFCASLRYANLMGCDLRKADLRGANLQHANLTGTGVIAMQVGPFWAVVTPDEAFIMCERKSHKEWEALTQEQAARMERGDVMWAYRPLLLEAMKRCRVLGWQKQEGEAA